MIGLGGRKAWAGLTAGVVGLHPVTMGIDFHSGVLFLVRSPSSALVRIDFTEALPARTQGWKRVSARAVVLSTDHPEEARARLRAV